MKERITKKKKIVFSESDDSEESDEELNGSEEIGGLDISMEDADSSNNIKI